MKLSDFYFDLPEELIAQKPAGIRGQDKLMLLNRETGEESALAVKKTRKILLPTNRDLWEEIAFGN